MKVSKKNCTGNILEFQHLSMFCFASIFTWVLETDHMNLHMQLFRKYFNRYENYISASLLDYSLYISVLISRKVQGRKNVKYYPSPN